MPDQSVAPALHLHPQDYSNLHIDMIHQRNDIQSDVHLNCSLAIYLQIGDLIISQNMCKLEEGKFLVHSQQSSKCPQTIRKGNTADIA